jgi:hypothetical protein
MCPAESFTPPPVGRKRAQDLHKAGIKNVTGIGLAIRTQPYRIGNDLKSSPKPWYSDWKEFPFGGVD